MRVSCTRLCLLRVQRVTVYFPFREVARTKVAGRRTVFKGVFSWIGKFTLIGESGIAGLIGSLDKGG